MAVTPFVTFLKANGIRNTKERLQLYEGVRRQRGHFTIDALVHSLKDEGYKVSRDTVYRNLPLLRDAGVIQQSFRADRETVYEVAQGKSHHDHLLCRKCGTVKEFVDNKIEAIQKEIAKRLGYTLEGHSHQLVGLCTECRGNT